MAGAKRSARSITTAIGDAFGRLQRSPELAKWLEEQRLRADDYVVVNNSFSFREVDTPKSTLYLAAQVASGGTEPLRGPVVCQLRPPLRWQNKTFRRDSASSLELEDLGAALTRQKEKFGRLAFALIGDIVHDKPVSVEITSSHVKSVTWDRQATSSLVVTKDAVTVNDVADEDLLWQELVSALASRKVVLGDDLKAKFAKALDSLQGMARASLRLPRSGAAISDGVLDRVVAGLTRQVRAYEMALQKRQKSKSEARRSEYFHEVLRIAYAFAGEAATLLKLIVSVCDLKPIILWATVDRHLALAEALADLPWSRSNDKPSLKNYAYMIGDARNHAFHNVLPFDNALAFQIPANAIQNAELIFFGEYGAGTNQLAFDDKELFDVMLDFTRARKRATPEAFWSKNALVMTRIVELVQETNTALKYLYAELG